MLVRWYLLLGQFLVTFEYRPGSQHANADGMSRQCGQCRRPDCPVSATDLPAADTDTQSLLVDQPFASSEMGDSMDFDGFVTRIIGRNMGSLGPAGRTHREPTDGGVRHRFSRSLKRG